MQALRVKLREVARLQMPADPAHDLAHLDRVWGVAQDIAQREGGDLRVLLGAAYLHDLVNLPKDAPDRHTASPCRRRLRRQFCSRLGIRPTRLTKHVTPLRPIVSRAGLNRKALRP